MTDTTEIAEIVEKLDDIHLTLILIQSSVGTLLAIVILIILYNMLFGD